MAALVSSCDDSALDSEARAGSKHSDTMNSQLVENAPNHFETSDNRKLEINGGVDSKGFYRFKKLKVSAVREFPEGCGSSAQEFPPTTLEDDDIGANVEKLIAMKDLSSTSDHIQRENTIEKYGQFDESSKDAIVMEHLEPSKILQPEHAAELTDSMDDLYPLDTPKYVAHLDPFPSFSLPESPNINDLMQDKSSSPVSTWRSFPYVCGRNAWKLTEVKKHRLLNFLRHDEDDNAKSWRETCTAAENEIEADEHAMVNVRNNFPVKLVSKSPSSLSKQKALSGPTDRQISGNSERLAEESAASPKEESDRSNFSMMRVCMNPNSKDQYNERGPMDLEFFEGKVVVLALMAAQICPWMQSNVSDESEEERT